MFTGKSSSKRNWTYIVEPVIQVFIYAEIFLFLFLSYFILSNKQEQTEIDQNDILTKRKPICTHCHEKGHSGLTCPNRNTFIGPSSNSKNPNDTEVENLYDSDEDNFTDEKSEESNFSESNQITDSDSEFSNEKEVEIQTNCNNNKKTKNDNNKWERLMNLDIFDVNDNPDCINFNLPQFVSPEYQYRNIENIENTPKAYFTLFISGEMKRKLCQNTNNYAKLNGRNKWTKLETSELDCFLGVIFYMGIIQLSERSNYWDSTVFHQPWVNDKMTLERFSDILICLHFVDMSNLTAADRENNKKNDSFWIIRPFFELLSKHCYEHFTPGQFISLDESCIPFTGRHISKQYNPNKPKKWHIKHYSLNDPTTGYLLKFIFYGGNKLENENGKITGAKAVDLLTADENLFNKGHIVVMDRYYTGFPVYELLKERGIEILGTVMTNRINPPQNMITNSTKNINRGDYQVFNHTSNANLINWKDNKVVNVLTSLPTAVYFADRKSSDGMRKKFPCPTVISLYTKYMRGTDIFDQKLSYFFPNIRSNKWTPRVFIHCFYIAIVNSHILFKQKNKLKRGDLNYELKDYITTLLLQLCEAKEGVPNIENIEKIRKRCKWEDQQSRFFGNHTPYYLCEELSTSGNTMYVDKRIQCAYCRTKTSFKCLECGVGLHIGSSSQENCFWKFHHLEEFEDHTMNKNKKNNTNAQFRG